jgi:hypothetical protein
MRRRPSIDRPDSCAARSMRARADQHRHDQASLRCLQRAAERHGIAGVHHRRRERRPPVRRPQQLAQQAAARVRMRLRAQQAPRRIDHRGERIGPRLRLVGHGSGWRFAR